MGVINRGRRFAVERSGAVCQAVALIVGELLFQNVFVIVVTGAGCAGIIADTQNVGACMFRIANSDMGKDILI